MDLEAVATICKEYFVAYIYIYIYTIKIVRVTHAYAIAGVAV